MRAARLDVEGAHDDVLRHPLARCWMHWRLGIRGFVYKDAYLINIATAVKAVHAGYQVGNEVVTEAIDPPPRKRLADPRPRDGQSEVQGQGGGSPAARAGVVQGGSVRMRWPPRCSMTSPGCTSGSARSAAGGRQEPAASSPRGSTESGYATSVGHGRFWGMTHTPQPPAGWYPDPAGSDGERFWDGVAWSQATRDKPAPPPTADGLWRRRLGSDTPSRATPNRMGTRGRSAGTSSRCRTSSEWRTCSKVPMATTRADPVAGRARRRLRLATARVPDRRHPDLGDRLDRRLRRSGITVEDGRPCSRPVDVRDLRDVGQDNPVEGPAGPPRRRRIAPNTQLTIVLIFVLFTVYRSVMVGTVSATLGQMAAGLRVVKLGEGPDARLGWGAAVVRGTAGAFVYVLWYRHPRGLPPGQPQPPIAARLDRAHVRPQGPVRQPT